MDFHQVSANKINLLFEASTSFLALCYFKLLLRTKLCSQNIWFLSSCNKFNVFPKYITFKTSYSSKSAELGLLAGKKKWLLQDLKTQYTKRDVYNVYLKVVHGELTFRLHPLEFDSLDYNTRLKISSIVHKKYKIQDKKLSNLISKSRSFSSKSNDKNRHFSNHKFFDRFVNLSNVNFSHNEINLINKGFKHNLNPTDHTKIKETLGVECEIALQNFNNIEKHILANTIVEYKSNYHKQFSEHKTAISIKKKAQENDLVFTKADKGNSVVAIPNSLYISKTLDFISNSKIQIMKSDPTLLYQKLIKSVINDVSIFSDFEKQSLLVMNPQTPKMYSLVKLHKIDHPIRPVVSFVSAPSTKLSKKLIHIIQQYTNFKAQYCIQNSYQLVDKIKNINIPKNAKLISFDVQNLFPSIPPHEVITLVEDLLIKNNVNIIIKQDILDCLSTCLDQNYFEFNNSIYCSNEGLIMGNPLSPLLAEIFMNNLETKILKHPLSKNFIYWYRYVDDILTCFKGTDRQLNQFLIFLNDVHPNIKFTIEKESNKSINFLDLTISTVNSKHNFSIFHKPSHTDTLIHNSSVHPYSHKMAAFNSHIHRLLNIPLSKVNYEKELNFIKQLAVNNGYNADIIDRIIKTKLHNQAFKLVYPISSNTPKKYNTLTYTGSISKKISKFLSNKGLKIAFKTANNLGKFIKNNKSKSDKYSKSGVYRLNCGSCSKFYIGQTGRSFNTRIKEHRASFLKNNSTSHYAIHLNENSHLFDHNFQILHTEIKSKKLNFLESLEINKYKKSGMLLNEQVETNNSPLLNLFA